MKIYHNTRCSKSRCALDWLIENEFDVDVVDYIKNPIDKEELKNILNHLQIAPLELIRKNETEYKEFISGKNLDDDEIISIMVAHPKLIERPIVLFGKQAVVARPLEKLIDALRKV